jgi:hypothetical protein
VVIATVDDIQAIKKNFPMCAKKFYTSEFITGVCETLL